MTAEEIKCIFEPEPGQLGLRGDRYLWKALRYSFETERMPLSDTEFLRKLYFHFIRLTGHPPIASEMYYVEQFSFGGMSSGQVYADFWLNNAFTLMVNRYNDVFNKEE